MRFSDFEIRELFKAWFAVSLAFGIVLGGVSFSSLGKLFGIGFLSPFIFSALTVGIAFLGHELAHKFLAQKYGCFAEFMANTKMLFFAVFCSFFGFIFAAPGGVVVHGQVNRKQFGKISAAGVIVNLAMGFIFLISALIIKIPMLQQFFVFGFNINSWLAAFNMLPFMPFDGAKVLAWSKMAFYAIAALCVTLLVLVELMPF